MGVAEVPGNDTQVAPLSVDLNNPSELIREEPEDSCVPTYQVLPLPGRGSCVIADMLIIRSADEIRVQERPQSHDSHNPPETAPVKMWHSFALSIAMARVRGPTVKGPRCCQTKGKSRLDF